jgi:hypothetical protein
VTKATSDPLGDDPDDKPRPRKLVPKPEAGTIVTIRGAESSRLWDRFDNAVTRQGETAHVSITGFCVRLMMIGVLTACEYKPFN